jgi:replicative superfamily II helicase
MIYTSPLKALSNQKFRDFKELFGKNQVGLVTGDVSINPGAPMLIMTTEIFRNWCLSEPAQLEKISYVVFDEIHYLDDMERGTTGKKAFCSHRHILKYWVFQQQCPMQMKWQIGLVRSEAVT